MGQRRRARPARAPQIYKPVIAVWVINRRIVNTKIARDVKQQLMNMGHACWRPTSPTGSSTFGANGLGLAVYESDPGGVADDEIRAVTTELEAINQWLRRTQPHAAAQRHRRRQRQMGARRGYHHDADRDRDGHQPGPPPPREPTRRLTLDIPERLHRAMKSVPPPPA